MVDKALDDIIADSNPRRRKGGGKGKQGRGGGLGSGLESFGKSKSCPWGGEEPTNFWLHDDRVGEGGPPKLTEEEELFTKLPPKGGKGGKGGKAGKAGRGNDSYGPAKSGGRGGGKGRYDPYEGSSYTRSERKPYGDGGGGGYGKWKHDMYEDSWDYWGGGKGKGGGRGKGKGKGSWGGGGGGRGSLPEKCPW